MSKFTEGLALLQEDFKERFGVDVDVWMRVHSTRTGNAAVATRELAEQVTTTLKGEIGGDQVYCQSTKGNYEWIDLTRREDNGTETEVTVFYPVKDGAAV